MTHRELIREIANRSRTTERRLAQDDVKVCFSILQEIVGEELLKDDGKVLIKDFLSFYADEQKGKYMPMYDDDRRYSPDKIVPKVKYSRDFKQALDRYK